MSQALIVTCPAMGRLAEKLDDHMTAMGRSQGILPVQWDSFPDGWPDMHIPSVHLLDGAEVVFLAAFERPADVFVQLALACALPHFGVASLEFVLPYFPGTMDRLDCPGRIVTAKSLTRQLSQIPRAHGCRRRITFFDIHDLHELHYFTDDIGWRNCGALSWLLSPHLAAWEAELGARLTAVFPDEGAYKRFADSWPLVDAPEVLCGKRHEGGERIVTILEGDPRGCHCLIVDDLIMSGKTLIACSEALQKAGAASVRVFATHAVCPQDSWRRLADAQTIERVIVTDSCPWTASAVHGEAKFEVLSLAQPLAKLLTKGCA